MRLGNDVAGGTLGCNVVRSGPLIVTGRGLTLRLGNDVGAELTKLTSPRIDGLHTTGARLARRHASPVNSSPPL